MPFAFENAAAPATPAAGKIYIYAKTDKNLYIKDEDGVEKQVTTASASTVYTGTCDGRLTLTTAVPVTTSDVTAATNVYFTPTGQGGQVALYTASVWTLYTLTERTLSLSGLTTSQPYDIFLYDASGTLTLEAVAWTSNTARATALVLQNGVYCKTGALDRRYVGTIKMQATGQCEDSKLRRFVWNMYNRHQRDFWVFDTTNSYSYTTGTWRASNTLTALRVEVVIGLSEDPIFLNHQYMISGGSGFAGICLDNTTQNDARTKQGFLFPITGSSVYNLPVAIGYHFFQMVEKGGTSVTFYGDNNTPNDIQMGMSGNIAA